MSVYSVSLTNGTVSAAPQALVFVNPAASPSADLSFMRFWAGQGSTATSAQLNMKIAYQATAFPTLTAATPTRFNALGVISVIAGGTAGAAGTAGVNGSVLGAGTSTLIVADACSNLNGYLWVASMKEVVRANASSSVGVGLYLLTAPSVTSGWNMGCTYEEL